MPDLPDRIPSELLAPIGVDAVEAALQDGDLTHPAVSSFRVETTGEAVWAAAKDAEARAYIAHTEAMAREYHQRIDEWAKAAKAPAVRTVAFMEGHLERFALAERERTNGRTKSIHLPSGVIRTRQGSPVFVMIDAEAFMDWAQEAVPDAVKWERRPLTSQLTGLTATKLADGAVYAEVFLAETGEKIPGIAIDPGHPTAKVSIG